MKKKSRLLDYCREEERNLKDPEYVVTEMVVVWDFVPVESEFSARIPRRAREYLMRVGL